MLSRVQIKNFKCYGEEGIAFSLKRVNFIFGDNSVGKSTFLQLIRMVLNGETKKIDENFDRYVFQGNVERKIELHMMGENAQSQAENHFPIYSYVHKKDVPGVLEYKGWKDDREAYDSHKKQGDKRDLSCEERKHLWLPQVIHQEAARPTRLGMGGRSQSSLERGQSALLSTESKEYINHFFKSLGVPYSVKNLSVLKDDFFGVEVAIENVGAGIDGLYETALKLWEWRSSKPEAGGALLALEEPEAHVNERQIVPLMDAIFKELAEFPNGQLVIECHSELILLKVMEMLRKKDPAITLDDVQILYALKEEDGTRIVECALNKYGEISNWPDEEGFFPVRDQIIFGA